MRYARISSWAVGVALLAVLLSYPASFAQQQMLNYFSQVAGGASNDNALTLGGTVTRYGITLPGFKAGTATLDGGNPTNVTTGLSSLTGCTATIKGDATPGDDPIVVTVVHTAGSGTLEIHAWKTNGSDPTLVASTDSTRVVSYLCAGS